MTSSEVNDLLDSLQSCPGSVDVPQAAWLPVGGEEGSTETIGDLDGSQVARLWAVADKV